MVARALVVGIALLAVGAPADAAATRAPCIPGQPVRCHIWTGTVGPVYDGDSIKVDIDGDASPHPAHIRITGIQAMELTQYGRKRGRIGECHAVEAAERLEGLIRASGSRVRIAALHPASVSGPRERLRRQISVRTADGWTDVATILLREGLALWFPNREEWVWNGPYSRLAEQAAADGVGLWDPISCGRGPSQTLTPLRLKVKWNAGGNDLTNLNGEWVRITNPDAVEPVPLGGWWFRDSHLRRFEFPSDTVVPAQGSLRVLVGRGTDSLTAFHWNLDSPVFDNATGDHLQLGDGGYLFDPLGNLRAYVQYPCRLHCHEPLAHKIELTVHKSAPEFIRLRNVSDKPVSLYEYEVERAPWFYELGRDTILLPGERLDVYTKRAPVPGDPTMRSWGRSGELLPDSKGVVTLRNPAGAPVTCDAWGGASCPDA